MFEISETADFSHSLRYSTTGLDYSLTNFKTGTKYYWRVNGNKTYSFETLNNGPRFIKIDGVPNVRDLGGNAIKQGMLFRGGSLNDYYQITEEGKRVFVDELGIKTELDLRLEAVGRLNESPAGDRVTLRQIPYRPYEEAFEQQYKQNICIIMSVFADESNYPVYFHCRGGADRTGMLALYLRALLGESDDDIHTDYELTSLSAYAAGEKEGAKGYRSRNASYYREFLDLLDVYAPGKPLSVKVKAFLLNCGVSMDVINRIQFILKNQP